MNDLFAKTNCSDARVLLEHWGWLTAGRSLRPVALTIFGDWFLEDRRSDAVWFLDAGMGTLEEIASSRAAWRIACRDPENLQAWFLAGQRQLLEQAGEREPGRGECYSWLLPPAAGGSLEIDNFEVCSLEAHQEAMARLTERLSELPPGTRVTPEMLNAIMDGAEIEISIPVGLLAGVAVALFAALRLLF